MKNISIFNDVLGPVMRGPSSSHTAGSYHIGRLLCDLLGEEPRSALFVFDPEGSYARVFRQQGADRAFVAGLLRLKISDPQFVHSLQMAATRGFSVKFALSSFAQADHPNSVKVELEGITGTTLSAHAKSLGGGMVRITRLNDWEVNIDGRQSGLFVQCDETELKEIANRVTKRTGSVSMARKNGKGFVAVSAPLALDAGFKQEINKWPGVRAIWSTAPLFFVPRGEPLFRSGEEIVRLAEKERKSLGELALAYESEMLRLSYRECIQEMTVRYRLMREAITAGFGERNSGLKLLEPCAGRIFTAVQEGRVALGGPFSVAAARAMAVMHTSNGMGVICAAPTGGSAGVIPAVMSTIQEKKGLSEQQVVQALFAAGGVGLIFANRATFAAEEAGCQVEIGAAGAMAAAAVVDVVGGSPSQALNAAAISLQNTMGSVCDLVQGRCEIPCHSRNAMAAANAFLCADLILGGYCNPIPFDETVDATLAVGRMLPGELRCTGLGGLAVTPTALHLQNHKEVD